MIAALRKLSERIDAEWKGAGYGPGDLPAIASRVLADSRPDREYDLGALADWTLTAPEFPDACNPFGPLGPPAFTVWSNPHFFVNVYVYTTPEVVVHDHDFSGAFMNLSGVTIHCTYELGGAEAIDETVHVGALRLKNIEAISEGRVRTIEAGEGFIHQVWHISLPTVVLVVRTPPLTPSPRQFQYLRPSIATQVFRNDSLSVGYPKRFAYTRKMAECLRTSTDGVGYVKLLMRQEQPWDAVWHLMENWRYLRGTGALEDVIALGAKHQGEWFAAMEHAGMDYDVFASINWPGVVLARDRIVLALLLSFRAWRPIRKALEGLLPGVDAPAQVLETLGSLVDAGAIALDLRPELRPLLAGVLRDGVAVGDAKLDALLGQPLLRPLFHPL
ncbi:MAG TPA: hypothetical protein VLC46_15785 [Thermoanaerobaculia bacterium]|jgi:hypothetical protein|nr:hypothetical protein [Thermoanaerobaculia bacterium]